MHKSLIDDYIPLYQVRSHYATWVDAHPRVIYPVIRDLDFSDSAVIRFLFKLRGINLRRMSLSGLLQDQDFHIVGEVKYRELLVGFGSKAVNPGYVGNRTFLGIDKKHYQIGWNFTLQPTNQGTLVATETRVLGLTRKAKVIFALYWVFIGPFSGWIRRIMLDIVKKKGEELSQEKTKF